VSARCPVPDQVAIAGLGLAPYSRANTGRTPGGMAIAACVDAIRDAGIDRNDIDGIVGSTVSAAYVQAGLGIEEVGWWCNTWLPFSNQLDVAIAAVQSGASDVMLVYHSQFFGPRSSVVARQDPLRVREEIGSMDYRSYFGAGHNDPEPYGIVGISGYAAWAGRYMREFGADKTPFGRIAVNERSNAARNPNAVLRKPLTMEEYFASRIVREPLALYDMDIAVDGADALIVTTAERARDMRHPPVLVHAYASGQARHSSEIHTVDFAHTAQALTGPRLSARSDLALGDADVYCLYDGFTVITLNWLENLGLCGRGEAPGFLEKNWDAEQNRLRINGRALLNPHGGNLSEGHTDGSGHAREAVGQVRGTARERQVPKASSAVLAIGGLFNSKVSAYVLRRA
jgi:acetyl-CoA acetyltransferase